MQKTDLELQEAVISAICEAERMKDWDTYYTDPAAFIANLSAAGYKIVKDTEA